MILRNGDFAKAAVAFGGFLRRYPASGYADSARFWQGNALYGKRDYKEAIVSFRALVNNAPDHLRAPGALLAVANCQVETKDTKGARATIADAWAQVLRGLAVRDGSTCGYYPNSTAFGRDNANTRDGHYPLWGPSHFYARIDPSNPAGLARRGRTRCTTSTT